MSDANDVIAKIEAAQQELGALCHGKRFLMTIPVDVQRDSDVIIGTALRAAREYVAAPPDALRARTAELEAALVNVSVHSAFLSSAPRELLAELLTRCGDIARGALTAPRAGA